VACISLPNGRIEQNIRAPRSLRKHPERTYRDDEGNWKETNQFFTDYLPLVQLASPKLSPSFRSALSKSVAKDPRPKVTAVTTLRNRPIHQTRAETVSCR
jgi:hypothetical protein